MAICFPVVCSLAEPLSVFGRADEGLNHLGINEIAIESVELIQPKVVTRKVRIGPAIRITPQVPKVLHQDKRAVELCVNQVLILSDCTQYVGARLRTCRQITYQLIALRL